MGVSSLQASVNGLGNFSQLVHATNISFGIMEMPKPTRNLLQQQQQPWPHLRCPRCNSTNTKFCYYNNYSKTQPRFLCKSCRRHWTQGGTLRDVPVGGGRKNKRTKSTTTNQTTSAAASTSNLSEVINNNHNSAVQRLLNGNPGSNLFPEIFHHMLFQPAPQAFTLPTQPSSSQTALADFGMTNSLVGQREIITNNFGSYPNCLNNGFSTSGYAQTGTVGDISMVPPMQPVTGNWSTWDNSIFGVADPDIKPPSSEGC